MPSRRSRGEDPFGRLTASVTDRRPRTATVAALAMLAAVLLGVVGCGGASAGSRDSFTAPRIAYFNTVRYANVANPYPSSDYAVVDVDLRRVLLYNLDSRAGKHSGLGRCSNLDYVSYIHCLNPTAKVLLYQSAFTSVQRNMGDAGLNLPPNEDDTGCSTYAGASHHPSWFVHDSGGGELVTWSFANHRSTNIRHLMDVGNPGYQQDCANQIIGTVRKYGFDGVFLDDNGWWGFYRWYDSLTGKQVWGSLRAQNGYTVTPYPDDCVTIHLCSWMKALVSFNSYVAPRVRQARARSGQHLLVFANTGAALPGGDYRAVIGPLDGFMEESWTDGGLGLAQQSNFWALKAAVAAWGAANGKYEMFHSWNDTESGNTLGLAAMLLFAGGRASYSTSNVDYSGHDSWYPEYDTAEKLGPPIAGVATSATFSDCRSTPGVYYERRFRYGLVVVNPCSTTIGNVSLGGLYSGSGNEPRDVTSVTLTPGAGYILVRNGSSAGAPRRLPAVSLFAVRRTISKGTTSTLTWKSTGATACAAPWTSSRRTNGEDNITPATTMVYTITCNAATGIATDDSVLVSVRGTPAPSPEVTVRASPAVVESGYGSVVSWNSTNAASCNAMDPRDTAIATGVSGSISVFSLTTATYAVTCTGAGRIASGDAIVTVTPAPPIVLIGAKVGAPLTVIGGITLRANAPGARKIVYRFDGERLGSAVVQTDFFTAGRHWAEADITARDGKITIRRRALDVIAP